MEGTRHRSSSSSAGKSESQNRDLDDVELGQMRDSSGQLGEEHVRLTRKDTTDDLGNGGATTAHGTLDVLDDVSDYSSHALERAPWRRGLLGRMRDRMDAFMTDIFRSETDFHTAYTNAKTRIGGLASSTTSRSETTDGVSATQYLHFFPLRFRDGGLETEYGQVCGQLFIGRDFLVLCFTILFIIPTTWYLADYSFSAIDLREHSYGAWIAFHTACGVDLLVGLISLICLIFPQVCPILHNHYESFSYVIVFLWMSVLMIVMATFPHLVVVPDPMELLFNYNDAELETEIMKLAPVCRLIQGNEGLYEYTESLKHNPDHIGSAMATCIAEQSCVSGAMEIVSMSASNCAQQLKMLAGQPDLTTLAEALWLPFATYLGYVKQMLQVFKVPIVALAVIIIHFGTGMMFMDTLSPSRTKFTLALHIVVVPICALPFILLQSKYPFIVPVQEAALFLLAFTFVAAAGYFGRYAQEFQHRLLFCSWRVTSKKLTDLNTKIKNQKKQKKSSTAVEELITQVKECQTLCGIARNRGRRADVMEELIQMEKLLEKILEILTQTDNLYSVHFADTNEVHRQFIELYNKPENLARELPHRAASRSAQKRLTSGRPESIASSGPSRRMQSSGLQLGSNMSMATEGVGSGPKSSNSSPVIGFEFGSGFEQMNSVVGDSGVTGTFKNLPMPEHTASLLTCVGIDWDFDMLHLNSRTENIIVEVGYALLCRLATDLGCEEVRLIRFLYAIQMQYRDNPYHNRIHGAEVAHLTECLTRMLNAQRNMNSIDKVTLTVAAICHDVGHPGRNNQFFINAFDPLAVIYNDVAVLENFHSCLTFRTLENRDCNIFACIDESSFRYIRQYVIECILATDMKQHFESLSRFRIRRSSPEFNYVKNVEDRWLVARMCVKVADIGHNMPLSPLCDREKHADMAKSQGGFLEFVVKPLIKEIEEIDPFGRVRAEILSNIEANQQQWQELHEAGTEIELVRHTCPDAAEQNTVTTYAVRKIAGLGLQQSKGMKPSSSFFVPETGAQRGNSQMMLHTITSTPDVIRKHLETPKDGETEDSQPQAASAAGPGSRRTSREEASRGASAEDRDLPRVRRTQGSRGLASLDSERVKEHVSFADSVESLGRRGNRDATASTDGSRRLDTGLSLAFTASDSGAVLDPSSMSLDDSAPQDRDQRGETRPSSTGGRRTREKISFEDSSPSSKGFGSSQGLRVTFGDLSEDSESGDRPSDDAISVDSQPKVSESSESSQPEPDNGRSSPPRLFETAVTMKRDEGSASRKK
ncbi:putative cAMP phosphodiesterase [Neospora caninum Liverpool]|uniref:Phosphodiesterase n=1 Tax=Neospora caninum (strain Liverpool) TaxID=572307 RepID=F0VM78_NEOCL|nr:putative cAMP phosphodiesterase [Neospora caninum Liverpool]CBZ54356.1 putative cAMP phosphodiesterase [Neospora caninum Liverpool]|eukprot:XP_003884387.1 putative cAMP phosphodiesterase [Neospora caninum Liverpool]